MSVKSSQNKLLGKIFSDEIIKLMKLNSNDKQKKTTQYSTLPTDYQSTWVKVRQVDKL